MTAPQPARPLCPPLLSPQPRIAVIGGSLTGPAATLLLLAAGFDNVTCYEATPSSAPLGGGLISLEHSALDTLEGLGISQDEIVRYPSEKIIEIRHQRGAAPQRIERLYPGRSTTWSLLHNALTARVPVHRGRRLERLSHRGGTPVLHFTGGASTTADVIVFADGRASTGRALLDPARRLHYAGYVGYRGRTGQPQNSQDDFLRLQPCTGVQFNIAPVPGGLDWTFYLDATAEQYTAQFGAPPQQRLFAFGRHISTAARSHVDQHATAHLSARHAATVHATRTRMAVPVFDIDAPTRMVWPIGDGYAVLLGDSLAPVRPHTARGANNGIEQAAGLAVALRQHTRHGADLGAALNGWQRRFLPAAAAAVRLGPVIGSRLGLGATSHRTAPADQPALTAR
ncbi:monooxygenase [Actinoplanes sp. Pm04-4]|uniref:Monooxygenase n=1 Tax=Paractinoplanes pyxinae TaxID=2997416 RepID=A0ABT4BBW9_9ACTN|nr:FAD-dependent monooxygenase [Actinoplanes pyxinae]MCY1144019.1 monooxygenase [Actinoplanes pyxinae]